MGKASAPEKLWCEALTVFDKNVREFWPWMVGLTLVAIPVNYMTTATALHEMKAVIVQIGNDPASFTMPTLVEPVWYSLFAVCFDIVTTYIFTILFLREDPIEEFPDFSPRRFLYWLRNMALPISILYGPSMLAWIAARRNGGQTPPVIDALTMLLGLASLCFIVRYMLAVPLAASNVEKPLSVSWQLTAAHWWRLAWHWIAYYLRVGLLLLLVCIIPLMMVGWGAYNGQESLVILGGSIMISASVIVANMANAAFFTTACHILCQEKRQTDPGFTLITQN